MKVPLSIESHLGSPAPLQSWTRFFFSYMGCFGQELVTDQQVLDTIQGDGNPYLQDMGRSRVYAQHGNGVYGFRAIFRGSLEVSFMVVSPGRVCGLKTVSPAVGQYS